MAKKINLLHFGENKIADLKQLSSSFHYNWLPNDYNFQLDEKEIELFIDGEFNKKFSRAIFILESDAKILTQDSELLVQLPAYQILYESQASVSPEVARLLKLKEALPIDMMKIDQVFSFINNQYSVRQSGYKLSNDHIKVDPTFDGNVQKCGNSYIELEGNFPQEFKQVLSWKMTNLIKADEKMAFYSELAVLSGDVELLFKIFLVEENTSEVVQIIEVPLEKLQRKEEIIFEQPVNAYIHVSLYARGKKGKIQVSQVHIRKALADRSSMIPGGNKICLLYTSDAADE